MTHYICCPQDSIPKKRRKGAEYISLYGTKIFADFEVGDVALDLKKNLRASGIRPTAEAWDFCSIAMAVAAVDESALRKSSADGWTRVLKVEIQLAEPLIWQNQIPALEQTLRFLTGDFWSISLTSGGEPPPEPKHIKDSKADCVSLLSGGVDSLVGAIDLCSSGKKPILVSKLVSGDRVFQSESASRLVPAENHIQWSFNSRSTSEGEDSTRARSIIFFAYAALVASSLASQRSLKKKIPIYVPENGFISLNLPLTPLRMGTLSTKTTHPTYLNGLQMIWDAVGINAELISPFDYRFRTKGEILDQCLNKDLLAELIGRSTSCGRYGVYNHTHCGRCVPCLVRRAAFLRAGLADTTELSSYKGVRGPYVFMKLAAAAKKKSAVDIRAAGRACLQVEVEGVERFIAGGLAFASREDRPRFVGVVERGLAEIQALLKKHRVL
jgi:hypothetical protein